MKLDQNNSLYLCFLTYDGRPSVVTLHRFVEELGGDDGAITPVGLHWHYQELLTSLFQQLRRSHGHRGL